jgi:hypothetical protein
LRRSVVCALGVFEFHLGHVRELELRQERRTYLRSARAVGGQVLPEYGDARAAQHQERENQDDELLACHDLSSLR